MLAVFFILDVTTFWAILWNERTSLTSMSPTLGMGILLCSLYYFAGALVFPEAGEVWPDLDSYYMRHRRLVLALMLTCYVVVVTLLSIRAGKYWDDSAGTFYMLVLAGAGCRAGLEARSYHWPRHADRRGYLRLLCVAGGHNTLAGGTKSLCAPPFLAKAMLLCGRVCG